MPKQIIIAEQHQIAAVFWEEQIQELIVATGTQQVSDIYLGVVENVLQGIDAAFVNIGNSERNGFIHVTDLGPLRLRKTAGAITDLLAPQQQAIVQVMKEPTGNKGPRLTGNISLPGRYLVLMPYGRGVRLSRRVRSESERNRLRALAILIKPSGMGLLVRTEADGQPEETIMEDLDNLQRQWESIQNLANKTKAPALLNRDDDFIEKVLRDMYSGDVNTIIVDSPTGAKRVKQHLVNWNGGRSPQGVFVDRHQQAQSILEYYRVNAAIREALKSRVELPSGGYIIIEPTEALTVVDVNSGSFTNSATSRETVLWTNREAATEIARQLRLRNIGGVIVVDFIDMDTNSDRLKLLEHFNQCLRADKARPQIAQLSELGLVELTRKRQGQNIYELFGHTCSDCGGLGHLAHLPGKTKVECLETPTIYPPTIVSSPTERSEKERKSIPHPSDSDRNRVVSPPELVNHPSYQERTSRRRRRRNDISLKEEASQPELVVNRSEHEERNSENNREIILQNNSNRDRRVPNIDSDRKSRTSSRTPKREEKVLEKVYVEMNELEQEIYALMGVSPLLNLDGEVKDKKSVLVYVKAPGEKETVESKVKPIDLGTKDEESDLSIESIVETQNTPVNLDKDESEESDTEQESLNNPNRRRRRRRSARTEVGV